MRRVPRKRFDDRGVALVELALAVPFLALLALGVLEYGNAWRQTGTIERMTQQAGRTVSSQANGRFADYEALRAISAAGSGLSGVTIDRVIIYRVGTAAGSSGEVPAACRAGSVAGLCNTYSGATITNPPLGGFQSPSSTTPSCSSGSLDEAWCPTTRSRSGAAADRVGVHITTTYTAVTGILPMPELTIERSTVYQVEPCPQGLTDC